MSLIGRMFGRLFSRGDTIVPVLRFSGAIGMATPLKPGLSIATAAGAIERAFSDTRAPAVAIVINSPGGSPVQSRLIYKRIRALAEEKGMPVYAFIEDIGASGGYLLALAGDEIHADISSIVGSIGVITSGFGLDKAIEKLGVERRVYTSGVNKMSLDPFQPEKPDDVERLKALQRDVHQDFIALVKERRGSRLQGGDTLFTGEIWSGRGALAAGLIDGHADVRLKMRELFGEKVKLKVVTGETGFLRRIFRLQAFDQGAAMVLPDGLFNHLPGDAISAIEERALWARFGF